MTTTRAALETRLTRYCAIDSQSNADSPTAPSTAIQLDLARLLTAELAEIGATDIRLTDYGAVIATLPGTAPGPTIAFLAHMDTAPQFNATGVKPRVIRGYNGGAISFPDNPTLTLTPEHSPELARKIGHDIVTASGTTLLGADDKAGIAIILTAARQMLETGAPRPTLRLAFTPDEEIGRGVSPRLPADLAAELAYTFDGGTLGEIEYETFSADGAVVVIEGVSIHPGTAKDRMVNAITIAARFLTALPQTGMTPETTAGREGFIHCTDARGDAARMDLRFILRDFSRDGLKAKGDLLQTLTAALAAGEPRARLSCTITPQYRNMRDWLEQDMAPVHLALNAARDIGLAPHSPPVRGGTDGSRLTELGLPCPNLFTGMQDIHGPLEWISLQDMERAVDLMLAIAKRAATP